MNNRAILEDISQNIEGIYIIYIRYIHATNVAEEKAFVDAFKDRCSRELKTYLIDDLKKKKHEIPNVETFINMIEYYKGDLALYKKTIGEGAQQSRSSDRLDENETKELKEFFEKNNSKNTNNTYVDDLAYFSRDDNKSKARDYFLILFKLEKIKDYASFENFTKWFKEFSQDENFKPSWLGRNRLGAHVREIQNEIIPEFEGKLKQKKIEPTPELPQGYKKEISKGIANSIQSSITENNLALYNNLESEALLESTQRDLISKQKLFAEKKSELAAIEKKISDWTLVIKGKEGDLTLKDLDAASTVGRVAKELQLKNELKDEHKSKEHYFSAFGGNALEIIDGMKKYLKNDEVNTHKKEIMELESQIIELETQLKSLENTGGELESKNVSRETSKLYELYKIVKPFLLKDENLTSEQINVFLEKGLPKIISGWNNMSSEKQQKKREEIIRELKVAGLTAGKEYLKQNGINVDAVVAEEKDKQIVQEQPTSSLSQGRFFYREKSQQQPQPTETKPFKPS